MSNSIKEKPTITTEQYSSWKSKFGIFYLTGIFGFALLSYYTELLDYTLLPRFALASIIFSTSAIFIGIKALQSKNNIQWPVIDLAMIFLLGYFIWATVSICWSTNFSEAIFESQKIIIAFAAFYFCRWLQLNDIHFVTRLLKATTIISVLVLSISTWQIFHFDPSIENALYEIRGISGHDSCGDEVHNSEIGPLSENSTLNDIEISSSFSSFLTVIGSLTDCNNDIEPDGYVYVSLSGASSNYIDVNEEGNFNSTIGICDQLEVTISGVSLNPFSQGTTTVHDITGLTELNVGTLITCW